MFIRLLIGQGFDFEKLKDRCSKPSMSFAISSMKPVIEMEKYCGEKYIEVLCKNFLTDPLS
jgi:hypothetical protein